MNRIYRLVWNHRLNAFVVGSELAAARGRKDGAGRRLKALLASPLAAGLGLCAAGWNGEAMASDPRMDELLDLAGRYAAPAAPQASASLSASASIAVIGDTISPGSTALPVSSAVTPLRLAARTASLAAAPARGVASVAKASAAKVRTAVPATLGLVDAAGGLFAGSLPAGSGGLEEPVAQIVAHVQDSIALKEGSELVGGLLDGPLVGRDNPLAPVKDVPATVASLVEDGPGGTLPASLGGRVSGAIQKKAVALAGTGEALGTRVATTAATAGSATRGLLAGIGSGNPSGGNVLAQAVGGVLTGTVDAAGEAVAGVLDATGLGATTASVVDGVAAVVEGAGVVVGNTVHAATGSQALASTVVDTTATLGSGLQDTVSDLQQGDLVGVVDSAGDTVGSTGSTLISGVAGTVDGLTGASSGIAGVGELLAGTVGGVGSGLGSTVEGVLALSSPDATISAAPVVPAPSGSPGLVIGTGGFTGSLGQLLDPTLTDLLGGDGYVRNGDLAVNSANVVQTYSSVNVLGIPVVNLSPAGTLLDGLGGAVTGGNSHLTLLGGVTSDSYIYNINNGDPNGLLGLVLPDDAPAWASQCLNVLGVATADCWAVNAAQDYQVLIGDGAYANGSKEVVIGTNARHELALQDASEAFPGAGTNDPDNPTGVPTADYDARLGHSVVIGDNATGTANAQTLIGAGATSDKANTVALGYLSNAGRGGQDGYTAFGLSAPQTSIGEVAVGSSGRERQITHVAAGSEATDAVNVAQLQGALEQIGVTDLFAVTYDTDASGNPDYTRVTLGTANATTGTVLSNLADGAVTADSSEAVNGSQLYQTNTQAAAYLGAGAQYDGAAGTWTGPQYQITSVGTDGSTSTGTYGDVGSAFEAVDGSLVNVNNRIEDLDAASQFVVTYDTDASGNPDYTRVTLGTAGAGSATVIGNLAAGVVSATSLEAVNGAQLYALGQGTSLHLGGGSGVDANGVPTAPLYVINDIGADGGVSSGSYGDVGSALDAISQSLANVNATGDTDALAVHYDAAADGSASNRITLTGDGSGSPVAIGNLASGTVASGSLEAINGGQLYQTHAQLAAFLGGGTQYDGGTGTWTAPQYQIGSIGTDGSVSPAVYGNVGDAFAAVDGSLSNLNQQISQLQTGTTMPYFNANSDAEDSQATGSHAVAIGPRTTVSGDSSVAMGHNAVIGEDADSSVAIGAGAQVHGASSIGVGAGNVVRGSNAGAFGDPNIVNGSGSYAFGNDNQIESDNAFVLGNDVVVAAGLDGAVVLGDASTVSAASAVSAVTLGGVGYTFAGATPAAGSVLSIGAAGAERQLQNVAAGRIAADSTDAVNGSQLYAAFDAIERLESAGGTSGMFQVNDSEGLGGPSASGDNSVAGGAGAQATAAGATALGNGAQAQAANSVALGAGAVADRAGTVSVGSAGNERQITNVAAGTEATDAVNVAQLQALQAGSVRYDSNSDGSVDYGSVTLGEAGGAAVTVSNVADGAVAAGSGEAVNGSQLYQTNVQLAESLGGGAQYDSTTSTWSGPQYQITSIGSSGITSTSSYGDVGSAFEAVDGSLVNVNQRIDNLQAGGSDYLSVNSDKGAAAATGSDAVAIGPEATASGTGSVALGDAASATAAGSVALGAGSVADRADTVSVGSSGGERQVTHVAAGSEATDAVNVAQLQASQAGSVRYDTRSDGSTDYASVTLGQSASTVTLHNIAAGTAATDAVNVGQLEAGLADARDWSKGYTDQRIRQADNRASAGVASAMATASLPQPSEAGRNMASIAASTFSGESGIAVGLSGVTEGGRWIYKLSGSTNTRGQGGVSIGAGIQW